MIHIR